MSKYSAFSVFKNALTGNRHWQRAWRDPHPKPSYDVIIVGAGGHGLATAYYLAKEHGIHNVAVIEKGWLGGGNTGRNTTIVRSNYMMPGNTMFYERSMKLWENLSQDLNYNVMISQRGQYNLCHSVAQMDAARRRGNVMRANGIDAELFDRAEVQRRLPYLDYTAGARFPIHGAIYQSRAGTARHDAVAWGYARAADNQGVDIIQQCEVTGYIWDKGKIVGVETSRGPIKAGKVGLAVAGHTGHLADMAGLRLPIETHVLQAFVTEPLKPLVDTVISFGAAHFYISQSDKGGLVMGGDLDGYNSYAQRGGPADCRTFTGLCQSIDACRFKRLKLSAPLGRRDGHVDGWLSDHCQNAGGRAVSERGLVLRRLQGHACLGLVFCPYHCQRRAPQRQRRIYLGQV